MRLVSLVVAALLAVGDVLASQPVLLGQPEDRAVSSKPKSPPTTAAPKTFPTFATNPPPSGVPPSSVPISTTITSQNATASATSMTSGVLSPTSGGSTSGTSVVAMDPFYSIVGTAVVCIVLGGL